MALVTEDGTGKADAESYVSLAAATTYHAAHSGSASWIAATDSAKENALRQATQWLDVTYKDDWVGSRYSSTQALYWPRYGLTIDEVSYETDDLPQQLLDATSELALRVIDGDTIFADMSDEGSMASKTVRVGPITKSVSYSGGSRGIKRYRLVEELVRVLIVETSVLERS